MALTPQNNDAFVREVDDELRRDKAEHFMRRYGRLVIVGVGLLLIASAGWLYWQHRQAEAAGLEAETLTQALRDIERPGKAEQDGRAALAGLAGSPRDGYSATARLALADVAMEKGDLKAAAATFRGIAEDGGMAQPFRDLALIRQTAAEYDSLPPGTVAARLQGLAVPGNAWFGSAGEMVAIAHLKAGRRAEAGRLFGQIAKDPAVPETIRSRAVQMSGVLGIDAVAPGIGGGPALDGTDGR